MGDLRVVNKYKHTASQDDFYIGRGSVLGNKYSHLDSKYKDTIKVNTRDEAVDLFADWLRKSYKTDLQVKDAIEDIVEALTAGDVNLVCFCKPKRCHGDEIIKFIKETYGI